MEKKYDVTALGELLIDFTQNGVSEQGNPLFEANPGGAPCNVLAMLQKLGKSTAFIGKVGDDGFGQQLSKAVRESGICTDGLMYDKNVHTTLAFVQKLDNGDRDFSFYRNPGADMNLKPEEVCEDIIRRSKIFHFGTLSLTDEPVRSATHRAVGIAEEERILRSFDPNLRPPLWKNLEDAKVQTDWGLHHCDILKIADNELIWFTGTKDYNAGIHMLQEKYNIPLICLSMGSDGSRAYYKDMAVDARAFLQKATVETTGAGDTFCACVLNTVLAYGLDAFNEERLKQMLTFANAAASIITTRKGALRVMPDVSEVNSLLSSSREQK